MFRRSRVRCNCEQDMNLVPCLFAQVKYASEHNIDLKLEDLYQAQFRNLLKVTVKAVDISLALNDNCSPKLTQKTWVKRIQAFEKIHCKLHDLIQTCI